MTKHMAMALIPLMFCLVLAIPVLADCDGTTKTSCMISPGDTVLVGEADLNITSAMGGYSQIAWWSSGSDVSETPSKIVQISIPNQGSFTVSQSTFEYREGAWYRYAVGESITTDKLAFYVENPTVSVKYWDIIQSEDVSGESVTAGQHITFRIDSNADRASERNLSKLTSEKNMKLVLTTPSGGSLTKLYSNSGVPESLTDLHIDKSTWYWNGTPGVYWDTAAVSANGDKVYPVGKYTIYAEFDLNYIKDNFDQEGAAYNGKVTSASKVITIASDKVNLGASLDSVVRGNSFALTITGKPHTEYFLWVKGTTNLGVTGKTDDMPPTIVGNQDGVSIDTETYEGSSTKYIPENKEDPLEDQVAGISGLYAKVTTDSNGKRTVEWTTTHFTKAQKYTFRVERGAPDEVRSDEVDVTVEKGAVTITASGDGSYYLGEEIKFSGTNTETDSVYLYITGPNLPSNGGSFVGGGLDNDGNACVEVNPPECEVKTNDKTTFKSVDVNDDNTWSWKWGTATVPLDAGTYTVFAVSAPVDKDDLNSDTAYGTVSVIIKKPFVSATVSQSVVARGDPIYIRGTAEGQPTQGIQVWVMGKNYATIDQESVNTDGSFEHEIGGSVTDSMTSGQYFVVVQHPMQNDEFNVLFAESGTKCYNYENTQFTINTGYVYENINCNGLFKITGSSRLQGSDAAEALVEGINNPNIDDTYTKLQFLVEEPIIQIDSVGDQHVGDKFTISAKTNLAVDDEILVEVYSSSFKPTQKSQSGEYSGATGTVHVEKGTTGLNTISFDVDASTFKPDEYIVTETGVLYGTTGTALFNILEAKVVTATPTTVEQTIVQVPPTLISTTEIPTTATPTKTPTQPGFGAVVALIGLGVVSFTIIRRQ